MPNTFRWRSLGFVLLFLLSLFISYFPTLFCINLVLTHLIPPPNPNHSRKTSHRHHTTTIENPLVASHFIYSPTTTNNICHLKKEKKEHTETKQKNPWPRITTLYKTHPHPDPQSPNPPKGQTAHLRQPHHQKTHPTANLLKQATIVNLWHRDALLIATPRLQITTCRRHHSPFPMCCSTATPPLDPYLA